MTETCIHCGQEIQDSLDMLTFNHYMHFHESCYWERAIHELECARKAAKPAVYDLNRYINAHMLDIGYWMLMKWPWLRKMI